MGCWRIGGSDGEHKPVLEIYHDDDAEPSQANAQRGLGDGGVGIYINVTKSLAISRLSVRIDFDWRH